MKALKGLVVMSQALEEMSNSLFINQVPDMWGDKVSARSPVSECLPVQLHIFSIMQTWNIADILNV